MLWAKRYSSLAATSWCRDERSESLRLRLAIHGAGEGTAREMCLIRATTATSEPCPFRAFVGSAGSAGPLLGLVTTRAGPVPSSSAPSGADCPRTTSTRHENAPRQNVEPE